MGIMRTKWDSVKQIGENLEHSGISISPLNLF